MGKIGYEGIISYSDLLGLGHHGIIYQASNFFPVGISYQKKSVLMRVTKNGKQEFRHPRGLTTAGIHEFQSRGYYWIPSLKQRWAYPLTRKTRKFLAVNYQEFNKFGLTKESIRLMEELLERPQGEAYVPDWFLQSIYEGKSKVDTSKHEAEMVKRRGAVLSACCEAYPTCGHKGGKSRSKKYAGMEPLF